MDERLALVPVAGAEDRSWVGLVAQAGIAAFIAWFAPRRAAAAGARSARRLRHRAARADPVDQSLRQTLDLVRTVVDVVEERGRSPGRAGRRAARCARRCCATRARSRSPRPQVYARGRRGARRLGRPARGARRRRRAPRRGRRRRCSRGRPRSGWGAVDQVAVVVGTHPAGARRRRRRRPAPRGRRGSASTRSGGRPGPTGWSCVLGGVDRAAGGGAGARRPLRRRARSSSGPTVPHLFAAGRSARAALSGLVAAPAWPAAPRPVAADDLLPERVLAGDPPARGPLVDRIYRPLAAAGGALLETAARLPRDRRRRSRRRPAPVRPPQHGALPAGRHRRGHRLRPDRPPRGATPCGSPWPWAGSARRPRRRSAPSATSDTRYALEESSKLGAEMFVGVVTRRSRATGRLDTCSRSSALDRAPRPPASSPLARAARRCATARLRCPTVAGLDLVAHGTTSDADTIRDTAVAQPLIVGRRAASPCRRPVRRQPGDARRPRLGVRRRALGRRDHRRRRSPACSPPSRRWCFVRERGRAMADGQRRHPDRHERGARRRPRRGRRGARAARPHRRPTSTAPARSSPPAPSSSSPRWPPTRRPRPGSSRSRSPARSTPTTWLPPSSVLGRLRPSHHAQRPAASRCCPTPTARSVATAREVARPAGRAR